ILFIIPSSFWFFFFFFNDTATTEIYTTRHTLSLHDALPICRSTRRTATRSSGCGGCCTSRSRGTISAKPWTRSEEHTSELQSRLVISYAVFCLKKKKKHTRKTGDVSLNKTRQQNT